MPSHSGISRVIHHSQEQRDILIAMGKTNFHVINHGKFKKNVKKFSKTVEKNVREFCSQLDFNSI